MKILLSFTLILSCFALNVDHNRNYYMPLAAAAYSNSSSICLSKLQKFWNLYSLTLFRQYSINCNSLNDTCSGYTAINDYGNGTGVLIVAFAGTTNYEEFYGGGWNYEKMVSFVGGGKVSKTIFDAFNNIWINAGMKDDALTLKNRYPNYNFVIVGHSTGGAMASLAAATIVSTGIAGNANLVTFGQPRVGDKNYANAFNSMFISSYRIIHNRDIVPHIPTLNSTFYYHHVEEWWYPNDMGVNDTYLFCYEGESPYCSDRLNGTLSFDDHKYYFGREFSEYGIKGCAELTKTELTTCKK